MQISKTLWEAYQNLLAADVGSLASVTAMHVHLVKAPFNPALTLTDIETLTLATFTGSAPKVAGTGPQQVFYDQSIGKRVVQILEPVGGWTWLCTVDPDPAEVIYGFVLTNTADTVIHGSELLPAPVTISAAGQGIILPAIRMAFMTNSPQ